MSVFGNFWWWALAVSVALIVFLMVINGFLRGALRAHADAVLGCVWVGLLVITFIVFGWLSALIFFAGSFVFGAITLPIARSVAARLLNASEK